MRTPNLSSRVSSGCLIISSVIFFSSCVLILLRRGEEITLVDLFTALLASALGLLFLLGLDWLSRKLSPTGRGMRGQAVGILDPVGYINLNGEIMQGKALEETPINQGEEIIVDRIEGEYFLVKRYVRSNDLQQKSDN